MGHITWGWPREVTPGAVYRWVTSPGARWRSGVPPGSGQHTGHHHPRAREAHGERWIEGPLPPWLVVLRVHPRERVAHGPPSPEGPRDTQ